MALKKEIELYNGTLINYHKISNIIIDNDNKKLIVLVKSYVNKSSRNKEKTLREKEIRIQEIMKIIDDELLKPEADRDTDMIISLTEENNTLTDELEYPETDELYQRDREKLTYIQEKSYELDYTDDITTSYVYNKLKELDVFINSDNI